MWTYTFPWCLGMGASIPSELSPCLLLFRYLLYIKFMFILHFILCCMYAGYMFIKVLTFSLSEARRAMLLVSELMWTARACLFALSRVHSRQTELNCTKLTQLYDAWLVTRVSVTKLIGCSARTAVQFSWSAVNTALALQPTNLACTARVLVVTYFYLFNTFTVAQNTQSASQTTVL